MIYIPHRLVVGLWMFLFRENLCAKMIDARKQRGIPKSELAGSTSLQAAVEPWVLLWRYWRAFSDKNTRPES